MGQSVQTEMILIRMPLKSEASLPAAESAEFSPVWVHFHWSWLRAVTCEDSAEPKCADNEDVSKKEPGRKHENIFVRQLLEC